MVEPGPEVPARWSRRSFLLASAAVAAGTSAGLAAVVRDQPTGQGPVDEENQREGTDQWRLSRPNDDEDPRIRGYASELSYVAGQDLVLLIDSVQPGPVTVEIYRMGWYQGRGARLMWSDQIDGTAQAPPTIDPVSGTIRAPWAPSVTIPVPADWVSGIYLAKLTTSDGVGAYAKFVVRDDARVADFLVQTPEFTEHAYCNWPNRNGLGKSLYDFNSLGDDTIVEGPRASVVSFDRPFPDHGAGNFLRWNVYMVSWLERQGYDLSYATNLDTHRFPDRLAAHRAVLSIGHDEYWTDTMYGAAENARDQGTHLAFFGANDVYWQVRLEPDNERPDRLLVCYKRDDVDPEPREALKTVRFRSVGRPEQALVGIMYDTFGPTRPEAHRPIVYENTATWPYEGTGATDGARGPAIVGYEVDRFFAQETPLHPGQMFLARSPYLSQYEHEVMHRVSLYQSEARSWVFAAGTIAWSWGLDRPGTADEVIRRMTSNVLEEFLDPQHLDDPTPPLPDLGLPTVLMTTPTQRERLEAGPVQFAGTARDEASGLQWVQLTVRRVTDNQYLRPDGDFGSRMILTADLQPAEDGGVTWSLDAALPAGDYEVLVTAIDGSGNASDPLPVGFEVRSENTPPTITVDRPGPGSVIEGRLEAAGAAADADSGVAAVEVVVRDLGSGQYLDERGVLGTFSVVQGEVAAVGARETGWGVSIPSELSAGSYYLAARAIDGEGNRSAWVANEFSVG